MSEDHATQRPYRIAVDFDGVIHSYEHGWHDGTIYGAPLPGAKEKLTQLWEAGYVIIINSCRAVDRHQSRDWQKGQRQQIEDWLRKHDIPYATVWNQLGKPWAHLYLDDKGIRFENWDQAFQDIIRLCPIHADID